MDFLFSRIRKLMSNSEFEGNPKKQKCDPELKKSIEKHTYTWILHNFFNVLVPKYDGSYLTSPSFGRNGSKYKWHICCYPNGNEYKNCISLYLLPKTNCVFPVCCNFCIKNSNDEKLHQKTMNVMFHTKLKCLGFNLFVSHDLLRNIKDDIVKIQVVISVEVNSNDNSLLQLPQIKLAQDLKAALKESLDTDFVLKVEDFELPVHKFIIAARSPIFFSMLKNDMLEKSEGSMQIKDIDKETLILLVDFIYTGNVTELSYHEAEKLLYAANKYFLSDLEKICENELIEKLKVSNVGDILILADLHNVMNLKAEAIDFIVQHHWKFVNSTLFQNLAENSLRLLNEVIFKLLDAIPCKTKTNRS